jgi:hypothetical protein
MLTAHDSTTIGPQRGSSQPPSRIPLRQRHAADDMNSTNASSFHCSAG